MAPRVLRFQWDPRRARYYDVVTGRLVAESEVRRALAAALVAEQAGARATAADFVAGRMNEREFLLRMRTTIKNTQLMSAFTARGGVAQMTQADYGTVGQQVRVQYNYLDQFVNDLRSGKQKLNGTLASRAVQYAKAGMQTHHRIERRAKLDAGLDEERNILHPADHCGDCPDLTGRALGGTGRMLPMDAQTDGWVPLGTLPPIGTRTCRGNDQCEIEYRQSPDLKTLTKAVLEDAERETDSAAAQGTAVRTTRTRAGRIRNERAAG